MALHLCFYQLATEIKMKNAVEQLLNIGANVNFRTEEEKEKLGQDGSMLYITAFLLPNNILL